MSTTPRLALPLMAPSQAAKHVTFNDLAELVDLTAQMTVVSRSQSAPPVNPEAGAAYLIPSGASGDWANKAGLIAHFGNGAWRYWSAPAGTSAWVLDEGLCIRRDVTNWIGATPISEERPARQLGINAPSSPSERLQVASPTISFSHDSTGPMPADLRLKLNKASPGASLAMEFQTAWSGRVEMGLVESDIFRIKTSSDGANWKVAWSIDPGTGWIGIGMDQPQAPVHIRRGATHPIVERFDDAPGGPGLEMRKARGTAAAPAAVLPGDIVQSFSCLANDGTGFVAAGNVRWRVEGLDGPGTLRSRIEFLTCGASSGNVERMRLTSEGRVGIGTASPTTLLDVAGAVRLGRTTVANLPSAAGAGDGAIVYVQDAPGGPVVAFSDGSHWRSVVDRSVLAP